MNNESKRQLASSLAEKFTIEELKAQKEMTQDSVMENKIDEVLSERYTCPECSNNLMKDEKKNELYCPACSFCIDL